MKVIWGSQADNFDLHFPIMKSEKMDDGRLMVEGIATSEDIDGDNEIVDYATAKAAMSSWKGNIREQHDVKKAVGKAIEVVADDATKTIHLKAFISKGAKDTQEKILDGTLTGFSVGGAVGSKKSEIVKVNGSDHKVNRVLVKRISEVSVVDSACNPSATFQLVKADGDNLIGVGIESPEPIQIWKCEHPEHVHLAKAEAVKCMACDMEKAVNAEDAQRIADEEKKKKNGPAEEVAEPNPQAEDETSEKSLDSEDLEKGGPGSGRYPAGSGAKKEGDQAKSQDKSPAPDRSKESTESAQKENYHSAMNTYHDSVLDQYPGSKADQKREGSQTKTHMDARAAHAEAASHFTAAKEAYTKGDTAEGDKRMAAGKEAGVRANSLSSRAKGDGMDVSSGKTAMRLHERESRKSVKKSDDQTDLTKMESPMKVKDSLQKGMYTVAQLASLLGTIACMATEVAWEAQSEGDGSKLPDALSSWLIQGAGILEDMTTEELDELIAMTHKSDTPDDLVKSLDAEPVIEKVVDTTVDDLKKTVDDLKVGFEKVSQEKQDLEKRLAVIEAQPAPTKGALKVFEKGEDVSGSSNGESDIKPVLKADGTVDKEATAFKKARASKPIVIHKV